MAIDAMKSTLPDMCYLWFGGNNHHRRQHLHSHEVNNRPVPVEDSKKKASSLHQYGVGWGGVCVCRSTGNKNLPVVVVKSTIRLGILLDHAIQGTVQDHWTCLKYFVRPSIRVDTGPHIILVTHRVTLGGVQSDAKIITLQIRSVKEVNAALDRRVDGWCDNSLLPERKKSRRSLPHVAGIFHSSAM
jgi:hypothetical protein